MPEVRKLFLDCSAGEALGRADADRFFLPLTVYAFLDSEGYQYQGGSAQGQVADVLFVKNSASGAKDAFGLPPVEAMASIRINTAGDGSQICLTELRGANRQPETVTLTLEEFVRQKTAALETQASPPANDRKPSP